MKNITKAILEWRILDRMSRIKNGEWLGLRLNGYVPLMAKISIIQSILDRRERADKDSGWLRI
jgi:hypothetical protein